MDERISILERARRAIKAAELLLSPEMSPIVGDTLRQALRIQLAAWKQIERKSDVR